MTAQVGDRVSMSAIEGSVEVFADLPGSISLD
jgi:hypothetical protein